MRKVDDNRSLWNIPAYLLPRLVLWAINQVKLNQCYKQFYVFPIRFHPQGDRWSVWNVHTACVERFNSAYDLNQSKQAKGRLGPLMDSEAAVMLQRVPDCVNTLARTVGKRSWPQIQQ